MDSPVKGQMNLGVVVQGDGTAFRIMALIIAIFPAAIAVGLHLAGVPFISGTANVCGIVTIGRVTALISAGFVMGSLLFLFSAYYSSRRLTLV